VSITRDSLGDDLKVGFKADQRAWGKSTRFRRRRGQVVAVGVKLGVGMLPLVLGVLPVVWVTGFGSAHHLPAGLVAFLWIFSKKS